MKVLKCLNDIVLFLSQPYPFYYKGKSLALIAGSLFFGSLVFLYVTYQWMTYPMWFVNQWRLPLLFVISGMGTFYALQKRSGKQFIMDRVVRLYIPLSIGMVFIIPPQVYFERLYAHQFAGNYLDFWPSEAFAGIYPEGNFSWHHLWFLPYLLLFSIVLVPVFLYLKNHLDNGLTLCY